MVTHSILLKGNCHLCAAANIISVLSILIDCFVIREAEAEGFYFRVAFVSLSLYVCEDL